MPIYKKKNEDFFKTWSPEMAYVLGFIVADGCLTKNKRGGCFTTIEITDKSIIYAIRNVLHSDIKISEYRPKNKNWNKKYRLQIGSKEIFNDLLELGVTPRKSKIITLPNMPDIYFHDFLRGYFDGDGCVNVCTYQQKDRKKTSTIINSGFVSGSKMILVKIWATLKRLKIVSGGTLYYSGHGHRLWFSIHDSLGLYHFMYTDLRNDLFLKRKKGVFEKYFKRSTLT
ncbi:MAG: hypothetical protein HZA35_00025 [Parcubacteria group bacterium]|nr:hypothetical protein [Parcubacteria group bacterium]